jgi:hypothetical protein
MFGKVGAANQQWGQMMAGYTSSPRPQTTLHFDNMDEQKAKKSPRK